MFPTSSWNSQGKSVTKTLCGSFDGVQSQSAHISKYMITFIAVSCRWEMEYYTSNSNLLLLIFKF